MSAWVKVEDSEGVRTIRLDRLDKKNALTADMYGAMAEAMTTAVGDGIGALVFFGGPGAFCAGNDVSEFITAAKTGTIGGQSLAFLHALARTPLPMLAAVDGLAIGVGTTLLFHCDHVLASERAMFRTPFTDLGLVPEAGSSLLGPAIMGPQRAFDLLVAGASFDAGRAADAGFVSRVVGSDLIEAETIAAARALAAKPRGAVAAARRLLKGDPEVVVARIDAEIAIFVERLRSPEAQAAFQAFMTRKG